MSKPSFISTSFTSINQQVAPHVLINIKADKTKLYVHANIYFFQTTSTLVNVITESHHAK